MSKYLLDTNICIHFMKGEYELGEKIKQVGIDNCYFSELTILELLFGVENSSDSNREKNRKTFMQFYKRVNTNIIHINSSFETYAIEKARLRKIGKMISEFDMLIGCSAIANDLITVTRNTKDFERLSNIQLENWIFES